MGKTMKKIISLVLTFALVITGLSFTGFDAQAAEEPSAAQEYEIYPTPRDVSYGDKEMILGDSANVVLESTIDSATVNRLNDVLAIKGITGSRTDGLVSGKTNILIGTNGSGGTVESWFRANVTYADDLFEQRDAYVLVIQDDVIAVLGKDTDAAFYGLSTLKMIFNQTEGSNVRQLQIEDYASGQYRGFIEGYYGIPWSVEDRISLMNFGGDFKMNIYIFAPKDDPYHNSQWRELYPQEELANIKKMVEAGQASKCRFAWAIHPFMHDAINASNYADSLEIIKKKFQQLYDAGVRQFVISADDALSSAQVQADLCRDMSEWVKAHEGTYNLVFVPQVYCTAAASWGGGYSVSSYFNYFKDLTDVELMWTGEWVCHPASQNTFDNFYSKTGREAFMWLNWPVNDVNHKRLVMGPAGSEILERGLTNFKGIVTNPLEQAEASKTSLFAIADFAWNTADFDAEKSWADGFKYIDAGAPEAMHELCKHMTNPSPGGITSMGESVELTPYINAFKTAYKAKEDLTESGSALIEQLEKIVAAADDFQTNGTNVNLQDEMKPWVDSLRYLSKACIGYVRTAMAIQTNDTEGIYNGYISAINNYKKSQNCESPLLNGTQMVEAGAMKIMPFAAEMDRAVKEEALAVLNSSFSGGGSGNEPATGEKKLIYSGVGGYYQGNADLALDGNDSTFVWFNASVSAGAYVGVDLGDVYKLGNIRILQGKEPTHGDIFSNGILEYSLDNEHWEEIGTFGTNDIETDVTAQSLKARYVRLRTPSSTGKWYAIREFQVETLPVEEFLYTNVEEYKDINVTINKNDASIPNLESITLKPGEYVGLEFAGVRELTSMTADYTNAEQITLEYSYNGFNWYEADPSTVMDAKWIRFINKNEDDVTFTVTFLEVENSDADKTIFAEPAGSEGGEAGKAVDNSLTTAFRAAEGSGSLTYRLEAGSKDALYILQDPESISNAKVSIHTNDGRWLEIGTLSKGLNVFKNLVFYGAINEVKIQWESAPVIYEMYTNPTDSTPETALQDAITKAEEVDGSQYTAESYSNLRKAIAAAKAVAENPEAGVGEKIAAMDELDEAILGLEKLANPPVNDGYKKLSNLSGAADSEEPVGEGAGNGIVGAAVDGDPDTFWHTNWKDDSAPQAEYDGSKLTGNNTYTITLDKAYAVKALTYLPRYTRDSQGLPKNGAITEANIYVSTDQGQTYTKVTNVQWSYEGEETLQEKTAEFEPVAGVTNIKIEAIHTEGAQPNMFINAAEFGVLGKYVEAPEEEMILEAPSVSFTVPKTGEAGKDAEITLSEDSKHFAEVADQAEKPATLTNEDVNVSYKDGGFGYTGRLTAANSGENNDKFDVSGEDNAMFIRFRMNASEVTGSGTYQMLGKMDSQYGVQLKSNCVLVYACDARGSWVESSCAIDSDFWNKWHDVLIVFTGTKMQIYVDGAAGTPTAGRANASDSYEVTLKSYSDSVFTTGYNVDKDMNDSATPPYTGMLADIRLYSGVDYSNNLQKSYAELAHALEAAVPSVNIAISPFTSRTTWYEDGEEMAAGAVFKQGSTYEVKTVLKASGAYRFTDVSKPEEVTLSNGMTAAPSVKVAADGTSMTISYTFTGQEKECTCEITAIDFKDQTVHLALNDTTAALKLDASASVSDCEVHEKDINYTYSVVDAGKTGAVLDGDVLTVKGPGKATIQVTVELNGKTATKQMTVTVTGEKASEEERTALQNEVNNAKAKDSSLYSEASWKVLEAAIAEAEKVLSNAVVSSDDVAGAQKKLQDAVNALKTKEEAELEEVKAAFAEAISKAEAAYAAGQGSNTRESWDAFVAAYNAAKNAADSNDTVTLRSLLAVLSEAQSNLKSSAAEKKLAAPSIKSVKATAAKNGVVVKVTVNPTDGADHYDIYRTVKGKTVLVGSTASGKASFNDTKAADIKGIKSAAYCAVAVSKDASVKASDRGISRSIAFAAKTTLKKAVVSGSKVKLTWKRNKNATGYVIYRSTKKSSGYKRIKKISKNKTVSYLDKGAKKKGTYYYKIVTLKKSQVSVMSSSKKVTRK